MVINERLACGVLVELGLGVHQRAHECVVGSSCEQAVHKEDGRDCTYGVRRRTCGSNVGLQKARIKEVVGQGEGDEGA